MDVQKWHDLQEETECKWNNHPRAILVSFHIAYLRIQSPPFPLADLQELSYVALNTSDRRLLNLNENESYNMTEGWLRLDDEIGAQITESVMSDYIDDDVDVDIDHHDIIGDDVDTNDYTNYDIRDDIDHYIRDGPGDDDGNDRGNDDD